MITNWDPGSNRILQDTLNALNDALLTNKSPEAAERIRDAAERVNRAMIKETARKARHEAEDTHAKYYQPRAPIPDVIITPPPPREEVEVANVTEPKTLDPKKLHEKLNTGIEWVGKANQVRIGISTGSIVLGWATDHQTLAFVALGALAVISAIVGPLWFKLRKGE